MSTLRDMNLSKLVAQDVPLFLSLISDLFPSLGVPTGLQHNDLKTALTNVVETEKLIMHPSWSIKVVQLYETTLVRHGIMMVGPSGSGKSRYALHTCLLTHTRMPHTYTPAAHKRVREQRTKLIHKRTLTHYHTLTQTHTQHYPMLARLADSDDWRRPQAHQNEPQGDSRGGDVR